MLFLRQPIERTSELVLLGPERGGGVRRFGMQGHASSVRRFDRSPCTPRTASHYCSQYGAYRLLRRYRSSGDAVNGRQALADRRTGRAHFLGNLLDRRVVDVSELRNNTLEWVEPDNHGRQRAAAHGAISSRTAWGRIMDAADILRTLDSVTGGGLRHDPALELAIDRSPHVDLGEGRECQASVVS